jgi:hypothetical protein
LLAWWVWLVGGEVRGDGLNIIELARNSDHYGLFISSDGLWWAEAIHQLLPSGHQLHPLIQQQYSRSLISSSSSLQQLSHLLIVSSSQQQLKVKIIHCETKTVCE